MNSAENRYLDKIESERDLFRRQRDELIIKNKKISELLMALKDCHEFPCAQERLFRDANLKKGCPHCAVIMKVEGIKREALKWKK